MSNSTKSHASGDGNVSEPRLMSQAARVREGGNSSCSHVICEVCETRAQGCHAKCRDSVDVILLYWTHISQDIPIEDTNFCH
jgi:hypothetical protein